MIDLENAPVTVRDLLNLIEPLSSLHEHVLACRACQSSMVTGDMARMCPKSALLFGRVLSTFSASLWKRLGPEEKRAARRFIDRIRRARGLDDSSEIMIRGYEQNGLW